MTGAIAGTRFGTAALPVEVTLEVGAVDMTVGILRRSSYRPMVAGALGNVAGKRDKRAASGFYWSSVGCNCPR